MTYNLLWQPTPAFGHPSQEGIFGEHTGGKDEGAAPCETVPLTLALSHQGRGDLLVRHPG